MATYILCERSQKSLGASAGFGGPDTYVAVQVVPEGQAALKSLNHKVAAQRGIVIHKFGQGYKAHRGPKSSLGQALEAARAWILQAAYDSDSIDW